MPSRFKPVEREQFRGLRTLEAPTDVPEGWSPDCRNVSFESGRVEKRAGTTSFAPFAAAAVLSIKEYAKLDTTQRRLLTMDTTGTLSKESGLGTFATIASDFVEATLKGDLVMNSVTMFGREYMAFSQLGRAALARPRQYDDTNLDPVAPEGPGDGPVITTGAVDATYGLTAGVHKFRVFFRTRTGYWTTLSAPYVYTAPGGRLVDAGYLPIGPDWVTDRVIVATPEGSDDYYFVAGSNMEVADNTTDTVTGIGWGSDAVLISGTAVSSQVDPSEDQLRLVSLPAQAGVVAFRNRIGYWGERATIGRANDQGFFNLTFNGGRASLTPNVPSGWAQVTAGGTVADVPGNVGRSFKITGTGAGGAAINNNARPLGNIPHGVTLRARMRAKRSAGAAAGSVHLLIAVPSTIAAGTGPTFQVSAAQLSDTEWRVIDGEFLPAASNNPQADWILRLSEGGGGSANGVALAAGEWIAVDEIEIYPASDPELKSLIRWSKVDDPESFDDLYGRQMIAENNGQDLHCVFVLREECYAVKDRSLHRIAYNPDTEPSGWGSDEVSSTVGTSSPNGVGHGDGWVVIAARSGLQLFAGGGSFVNLTEEITPTWERVNQKYAHVIRVLVNTETREIFVAVPLDGATRPNAILHLDYAGNAPATAEDRDWSIWDLAVSSMGISERPDGSRAIMFGTNGVSTSNVLVLDEDEDDDFVGATATAIDAYYQTDYIGGTTGRLLFGYMTAEIEGLGRLLTTALTRDAHDEQLATKYLSDPIRHDEEWALALSGARVAFKFRMTKLGERFSLRKLALFFKAHPWSKIRGIG